MQITSLSSSPEMQVRFSARQNTAAQTAEQNTRTADTADTADVQEIISLTPARLLDDSEVDDVLNATTASIRNDTEMALSAHRGLDTSRVAALLADLD